MEIISRIKESRAIPIVLADGTPDSVNLQGRGRLTLPAGAKLDPRQEKEIKSYVTVVGELQGSATSGLQAEITAQSPKGSTATPQPK